MNQDVLTGGVEPGGLWSQNDIRILLCYILSSVDAPLSGEDLSRITQSKGLANYFEVGDALSALLKQGNVQKDAMECYTVTEAGRQIAGSLQAALPVSVRDKALEAALRLTAEARARRENRVDITQTEKGFQVVCHVSDGKMDLMSVSLYAPDRAQAEVIERNFYSDPENIYRVLLAALTGDDQFLISIYK